MSSERHISYRLQCFHACVFFKLYRGVGDAGMQYWCLRQVVPSVEFGFAVSAFFCCIGGLAHSFTSTSTCLILRNLRFNLGTWVDCCGGNLSLLMRKVWMHVNATEESSNCWSYSQTSPCLLLTMPIAISLFALVRFLNQLQASSLRIPQKGYIWIPQKGCKWNGNGKWNAAACKCFLNYPPSRGRKPIELVPHLPGFQVEVTQIGSSGLTRSLIVRRRPIQLGPIRH
jgi:hypothetical protein